MIILTFSHANIYNNIYDYIYDNIFDNVCDNILDNINDLLYLYLNIVYFHNNFYYLHYK